jgi:hypothetical protein
MRMSTDIRIEKTYRAHWYQTGSKQMMTKAQGKNKSSGQKRIYPMIEAKQTS